MHIFASASLKNKALVALVTIVTMFFGVISLLGLKQELMPSVQFPAVAVVTSYPGASPEVVNTDISTPIETAVRGVPGLVGTSSTSRTGASMVLLEFKYGTDITISEQKVERAVSRIMQMLPDGVDPLVASGSIEDFPVIQIGVGIKDANKMPETIDLLETLAVPDLEEIPGVRQVQIDGATGNRVTITPDFEALQEKGLSVQAITDALQQNGKLLPAGEITEGRETMSIQVGGESSSIELLKSLPLLGGQAAAPAAPEAPADDSAGETAEQNAEEDSLGDPFADPFAQFEESVEETLPAPPAPPTSMDVTLLSDVAEVELTQNPQASISRINGESAVTIAVTKLVDANTVDVSHAVQETLKDLESAFPDTTFSIVFDQAPYIEQSIETLAVEGLLGLAFAILVILVFLLSVRATLVTAVSIPTSILLTFIGLNFADYTINMLTLGALTISIGRVVDDSIVVIENIKRHLSDEGRAEAIVRAVREVAGAITASTITTVAVFLPMAFVSGMVGELFRPFAFTITFALLASLLVSLTIVPVLAYWFLKPDKVKARRRGRRSAAQNETETGAPALADGSAITRLQKTYLPIIKATLKHPFITLVMSLLVFGGTIAAYPLMKTNFLGDDEQNAVRLTQTLEPGASLEEQLEQVVRVEKVLADVADVETVQVTIGADAGMAAVFGSSGDGTVTFSITTNPDADQEEVQAEIRAGVTDLKDAGEFALGNSNGGPTGSSTVDIEISAPNQTLLAEGAKKVQDALSQRAEFDQVESNLGTSRPTVQITVDREKSASFGLSEIAVSQMVSSSMQPQIIGQIILDETSIRVYLARDEIPETIAEIEQITVATPFGEKELSELAEVEIIDGPVNITTINAVRSATIQATPAGDNLTVASQVINEVLEEIELPGGVKANVGGVLAEQQNAFKQLGLALLAAILIVYVVMVATFRSLMQPLLLLISVPFAATGAILMLIVTGVPLGVASLIGVLMLVGIVVTNAIVLIDLMNQLRERGHSLKDAVITGAAHRYRPILMTALATIFALTPMALGITGKGGFISQPLAVVVIGGLLSSTVLTLVVLPTLYYVAMRRREK